MANELRADMLLRTQTRRADDRAKRARNVALLLVAAGEGREHSAVRLNNELLIGKGISTGITGCN